MDPRTFKETLAVSVVVSLSSLAHAQTPDVDFDTFAHKMTAQQEIKLIVDIAADDAVFYDKAVTEKINDVFTKKELGQKVPLGIQQVLYYAKTDILKRGKDPTKVSMAAKVGDYIFDTFGPPPPPSDVSFDTFAHKMDAQQELTFIARVALNNSFSYNSDTASEINSLFTVKRDGEKIPAGVADVVADAKATVTSSGGDQRAVSMTTVVRNYIRRKFGSPLR